MEWTIMPAFVEFPKEAAIIGRLLAGYGELEFDLCNCVAAILEDVPPVLKTTRAARTLFRTRGELQRVEIADALMREKYEGVGLAEAYNETIEGVDWCRRLRNQYAHCHWSSSPDGLRFVQLEKTAKRTHPKMMLQFRFIDEPLLVAQETYFRYVDECLWYLSKEYQTREGEVATHPWKAPRGEVPPLAYIGEDRPAPPKHPPTRPTSAGTP